MNPIVAAIIAIATLVVGLIVGSLAGVAYRKRIGEAKIGSAEQRAKELIAEGEKRAETLKKEALLAAKEDIMKSKNEMEQEIKDRRAEVSRTESRLSKKEENLDKKSEQLDRKTEQLDRKIKENETAREQIDAVMEQQVQRLEQISGYTAEQAKAELVSGLEEEVRHEMAQKLVELEEQYKEEADDKACRIMALAIQRCAGDFVAESTASSSGCRRALPKLTNIPSDPNTSVWCSRASI